MYTNAKKDGKTYRGEKRRKLKDVLMQEKKRCKDTKLKGGR